MAEVLVVTSGKGGVGKTTSTAALGALNDLSGVVATLEGALAAEARHEEAIVAR